MSKSARIYVVDDDESVRKALSRTFKTLGWPVSAFASGREFLDAELSDAPGCLILDVRMPGLSGFELQAELKARSIDLPIIFMTAHGDGPTRTRAMNAGAVAFFDKPVAEDQLLAAVRAAA